MVLAGRTDWGVPFFFFVGKIRIILGFLVGARRQVKIPLPTKRREECSSHDGGVSIILCPCLTPRVICFTGTSWKGAGLSGPPAYNPAWPEDRPLQIQGLHPCIPWEQIISHLRVSSRTHLAHQSGYLPLTSGRPGFRSLRSDDHARADKTRCR